MTRKPAAALAVVLVGSALAVLGLRSESEARRAGQFQRVRESRTPAAQVYVRRPVTGAAARIWLKLDEPISMPFENDTPLEDALEYIRQATACEEFQNGIPIYVDPIGLQEAEQTLQSPITMNLEGLPLRTTLDLMLDQLDLCYDVDDRGLLFISAEDRMDRLRSDVQILNELRALREEVDRLREAVEALEEK